MEFIKDTPENIEELVRNANRKDSWKVRILALQELSKYDCQQSRDVVMRLALHDKVYKVKQDAFMVAQALGLKKGGANIRLGRKDIGYKPADFKKLFQRIKCEQKMTDLNIDLFKEEFNKINPEMMDVMLFEKGGQFDKWIKDIYASLPKIFEKN